MKRRVSILAVAILAVGAAAYILVEGLPGRGPVVPPPPELSGVEPAVAQKILAVHAQVARSPTEKNWARFGQTLLVHGRAEESVRAYLAAAKLASDPFEYYYHAGVAMRHRDTAQTIRFFEEALRHRDDYMPLHVFLGESYLTVERLDEAEAQFEAARKIESTSHCLLGLGRVALRRNDLPAAIALLGLAREKAPGHREVLNSLAIAYSRAGSPDKAREVADAARKLTDPTRLADPILSRGGPEAVSYQAFHTRAQNLFTSGRYDEAIPLIEKALEIRPGYPDALLLRARSLLSARQPERAGRSIDEYLAGRRDARALYVKVLCLHGTGKFSEAFPFLQELCNLEPENLEARYLFATFLLQVGRPDEGMVHVNFILQRQPSMARARLLKVGYLIEHGRKEEARIEAESVLAAEPENRRAKALLKRIDQP